MKNQKLIIGIAVALLAIGAVVALTNYGSFQRTQVTNPEQVTLKEVACDISVANPRGLPLVKNGDLIIESANCQQQYVKTCGRFGIFSDKGSLRLEGAGGLGSAVDMSISEGSSQSYSLNWCGSKLSKDFQIKIFNENNENIQTKEVKLQ